MKKVGIMRINDYNKFFAKVAEIMNTSIEQLDGRYRVKLANHVNLKVFRGVNGSLFIHDHRGIASISSCYDFEAFKTIKDLYDRLVLDFGESAKRDVTEEPEEPEETEETVKDVVHKHIKATHNPEWHHVRLATLANIDNDMLDKKHKLVRDINQVLKDGICNLYKCENHITFDVLERYVLRKCDELIRQNHLKAFWFTYIAQQLDEVRRNTIYLYAPYITAHRNR